MSQSFFVRHAATALLCVPERYCVPVVFFALFHWLTSAREALVAQAFFAVVRLLRIFGVYDPVLGSHWYFLPCSTPDIPPALLPSPFALVATAFFSEMIREGATTDKDGLYHGQAGYKNHIKKDEAQVSNREHEMQKTKISSLVERRVHLSACVLSFLDPGYMYSSDATRYSLRMHPN